MAGYILDNSDIEMKEEKTKNVGKWKIKYGQIKAKNKIVPDNESAKKQTNSIMSKSSGKQFVLKWSGKSSVRE